MLRLDPTEQRLMSATSIGSSPVLEFARSMLEMARRRWPEHELSISTVQELKFAPFAMRIAPAEQESARNCSSQVQRTKFDVGDIDWIIGRAKFSTTGAARSSSEIMSLTPSIAPVVKTAPVQSSVIAEIGYDADARILEVRFHGGRVFHYFDVPPAEYAVLMRADSIGGYFNRKIFPRYRWKRIDAE